VPDQCATRRARILAVIVLYKQKPSASVTVATLAHALANCCADCAVLVFDNSAEPHTASETLPAGFQYKAALANHGLLGAYEAGLARAREEGYDWLLTLDQDTAVPENFFSAIEPGFLAAAENPRIAAIVPHLSEGGVLLSPAYVGLTRPTPLPASFTGVPSREARAFNSAALLRVKALDSIGGFDPCFWLDHLDSWLHHQLYIHGWRMYVLDSLHLEHQFSLLNYKDRLTLARFRNFLGAESAYIDLYGSWLARLAYTAQLGVRLVNQKRRGEAREILTATRQSLWRRLSVPRRERIHVWRASLGGWSAGAPEKG
jgi:GT2 family glycosyltransferase